MRNSGDIFPSVGGTFDIQVIGAICRLYDREQLPYPCCRLQWLGKEPFWNRVGKRFVPDIACKRFPSYRVKIFGRNIEFDYTEFTKPLAPEEKAWWYTLTRKDKNVCFGNIYDEAA